jgi:hypothetical protein
MLYYQWQSWRSSGEAFDLSKFVDTVWSGGVISVAASGLALSQAGLNFSDSTGVITTLTALAGAFGLAAGIDTAQNKTLKALKPKAEN